MNKFLIGFLIFCFYFQSIAQNSDSSATRDAALNLYIDCDDCDMLYLRQNFTIVNYVRDRLVADVHIIVTEMDNGGGGDELTFQFIGRNKFAAMVDTLVVNTKADINESELRKLILTTIERGLAPFILKTKFAEKISISYNLEKEVKDVVDPWRNWVFEIDLSTYLNGQQSYKSLNMWSSISASRITEKIKHYTSLNQSYDESKYRIYDGNDSLIYSLDVYRNSARFYHITVWSLGDHWGAGLEGNMWTSTYSNTNFAWDVMPAIEYNLFKYKEASQRQLRMSYAAGYSYLYYVDTTIYNKIEEGLFYHKFTTQYKQIVKWGNVEASIYYKNYLKDFSLYSLGASISTEIRLFKGLSLSLYGNSSLPRNQVGLVRDQASTEDVLLQQHELKTQFSYYLSVGLSYTFGSIYNNVVNPRLD